MENIRIYFVVPEKFSDENECSDLMHSAFELCKQNVNNKVFWVQESLLNIDDLLKTDFVVFEKFEGELFNTLKETKSTIVGPWTISICLIEGKPIPNYDWPIYNVAMYNCIVTSSFLPKNDKADIKAKVELMGGCYVDSLTTSNTHLIAGSAKSQKYLAAAESGVKLMCVSWVDDVWKTSQTANVHADDEQFKKHYCPIFHNLVISSTGVNNPLERKKLETTVKEHGGTFTGKLNLNNTDILICCGDVFNSEKYKAARQLSKIICVDISWVNDSVAKGYALQHDQYQIKKITSTPTKGEKHITPDFSILSAIGGPNLSQRPSCVDETYAERSLVGGDRFSSSKRKVKEEYEELIDNLDIKKAKRAGQYLDGCSVYLAGFNSDHTEKLNKIINLSGATRYDTFSDRITHVIVGDSKNHEVALIRNKNVSAVIVSVLWLMDCIENQFPVNEDRYLITCDKENSRVGSPLSKKGLNLLCASRTATEKELKLNNYNSDENKIEDEFLARNLNSSDTLGQLLEDADFTNLSKKQIKQVEKSPQTSVQIEPPESSTQQSSFTVTQDADSEMVKIFNNIKFVVVNFDEETEDNLVELIKENGGIVVSKTFKGIPDYAVAPLFNEFEIHHTATEIVNELFISECIEEEELLLTPKYYHRPLAVPDTNPIKNCVVTITSYEGKERQFIFHLIEALGGVAQNNLSRVRSESKKLLASTHLISPEPSGKKYLGALNWGIPVVTKDWLLDCARSGKKSYEGNYLVGDAKAPEKAEISLDNIEQNNCNNVTNRQSNINPKVLTPASNNTPPNTLNSSKILVPQNTVTPHHKRFLNSATILSPVTPVNKIIHQFEGNKSGTPNIKDTKDLVTKPWMSMKTPETPLGRFLTPNPSPGLRKELAYWLEQFPETSTKSNQSTPLSEIKKRCLERIGKIDGERLNFSQTENFEESNPTVTSGNTTPHNQQLAEKFQHLENMLSASGSKRKSRNFQSTLPVSGTTDYKDSQPCTVGWDFESHNESTAGVKHKIFMLTGIADESLKEKLTEQIELLGGTVSSLVNYDPNSTHLICSKPSRNEKSLSCMAAGKWILHISYIDKSAETGHLLNEEEFEYGNPKSIGKIPSSGEKDVEIRMKRIHWWRMEVARRGYGAFNDMRAIVVASKREPINRVIEAGGGIVIDVNPPFEDTVHATHCLIEPKTIKNDSDYADYIPLARQGVYIVNTLYISEHLHYPDKDIRDCILPFFLKYYSKN